MDSTHSSDTLTRAPGTSELQAETEVPRFCVALGELEQIIARRVDEFQGPAEEKANQAMRIMATCSRVAAAAQHFEFTSNSPDLAETDVAGKALEDLAVTIDDPNLDPEIGALYRELYAPELQALAPADGHS